MRIQILVAAMNQKDHNLLKKLNIRSDVIVGNQCGYDSVEHFEYNGKAATYLNFNEKGVGLNRNNTCEQMEIFVCFQMMIWSI